MRQAIARDFINLGCGQVKMKEDFETCDWGMDRAVSPTFMQIRDWGEAKLRAMRSSEGGGYELQPSVWDAALFFGAKGSHWHEQLLFGVGFVMNVILQSVFCLMVLHLGSESRTLDDTDITRLEVWLEQAEPEEVTGVCGVVQDHVLTRPGVTSRRPPLGFPGVRSPPSW